MSCGRQRATESYRIVHECLAQVMRELGQPATVKKQTNGSTAFRRMGQTGRA